MISLGEIICRFGIGYHQYAGDISLSRSPTNVVKVLNHCLIAVVEWLKANKLKLNPDKMEVMEGRYLEGRWIS